MKLTHGVLGTNLAVQVCVQEPITEPTVIKKVK